MAQPGPPGPPGFAVPPGPAPVAVAAPTREIRLNAPPVFDGNRKKFENFLQAVLLYTGLNAHIFNTNELKIGFTLSFLTEKEAALWCEAWVQRNQTAGAITYPTWAVFEAELSAAFRPIDQVGDAMHKLETLRQGGKTADTTGCQLFVRGLNDLPNVSKLSIKLSQRNLGANSNLSALCKFIKNVNMTIEWVTELKCHHNNWNAFTQS